MASLVKPFRYAFTSVETPLIAVADREKKTLHHIMFGLHHVRDASLVDLPPIPAERCFPEEDARGTALGHLRQMEIAAVGEVQSVAFLDGLLVDGHCSFLFVFRLLQVGCSEFGKKCTFA